jgi:hypothetical protein
MTNLELEAQYFKNSLPFLGKDLALRVEGKEDVVFWQAIFQEALPNVRVEIFHFANEFPSANAMGKEAILPLRAYADNKLCVCIDSDYDFLLGKNYNDYSPFVFQTYTYSIENYYAVASRLPNVIQKTANTSKLSNIDFEKLFRSYAAMIFEGFVYSILAEKQQELTFERHNFAKIATSEVFDLRKIESVLPKYIKN